MIRHRSSTGSDRIGDGTKANPWRTFEHALTHMADGDTLHSADDGAYVALSPSHQHDAVSLTGATCETAEPSAE